jgi:hypothetical protein
MNIDLFLFTKFKLATEKLIGFKLSQKNMDYMYSKENLDMIKVYCNKKILDIFLIDEQNNDIMYDELCMMDVPPENKYKINKLVTCKVKIKYDCVCGMDILLILMQNIYDIKYKKISKKTRLQLKQNNFKVYVI